MYNIDLHTLKNNKESSIIEAKKAQKFSSLNGVNSLLLQLAAQLISFL